LRRAADEGDRRGQEVTGEDRRGHFLCTKALDGFFNGRERSNEEGAGGLIRKAGIQEAGERGLNG